MVARSFTSDLFVSFLRATPASSRERSPRSDTNEARMAYARAITRKFRSILQLMRILWCIPLQRNAATYTWQSHSVTCSNTFKGISHGEQDCAIENGHPLNKPIYRTPRMRVRELPLFSHETHETQRWKFCSVRSRSFIFFAIQFIQFYTIYKGVCMYSAVGISNRQNVVSFCKLKLTFLLYWNWFTCIPYSCLLYTCFSGNR